MSAPMTDHFYRPVKSPSRIDCQHQVSGRCFECRHPTVSALIMTAILCGLMLACAWCLSGGGR
jgi:hypothetical protein